MAKQKFAFSTRMGAEHAIASAAGHGQTALKNKLIAEAHRKWPPKKGK